MMTTGIRKRGNSYEAAIYLKREKRKIRKTFGTLAAARAWIAWHQAAKTGAIRNRSGDRYKPSTLRSYEQGMKLRALPDLGGARLADVRRPDVQAFADTLLAKGLNPSTISGTIMPLRAIFGYAVSRGGLALNPCDGIRLPAVRGRRERIADPVEAASLIAAAPAHDCATWATAMHAGLRLGELQVLRAESIDLAAGVIHVERGWDAKEGEIELKTRAGRRKVPIPAALRDHLLDHLAHSGRAGAELVFGRTPARPFDPSRFRGVPTGRGAKPGSSGSHRMSVGIPSPR